MTRRSSDDLRCTPTTRSPRMKFDGSSAARNELRRCYQTYFPQLVAQLRAAFGAGPPEPVDVAQRAFERLLKRREGTGPVQNLKAYLWRTAHNIFISDLRLAKTEAARHEAFSEQLTDRGYLFSPDRVFQSEQDLRQAREVIKIMPEQRRKAFLLVRVDGHSHAEAARALGISRPAVTKHVNRAVQDLHAALLSSANQPEESS
ncbi:MAG: RNA polymerase sigma factor [Pseudomonadota bacterium]